METLKNEQTEAVNAQAAEADTENGAGKAEVSFGKFKDAEALLKAYNSLQAEFTKRCQRVKELEDNAIKSDKTQAPDVPTENVSEKPQSITDEEKSDILKDYLKGLLGSKSKAVVMSGAGAALKTPPAKPKTIAEAGLLAEGLLTKKIN